jgi:hypothetical protein
MNVIDNGLNDNFALMNMDIYFYHHIAQTYGLDSLALKYAEIYLASIEAHKNMDPRIDLFRKLIGLDHDRLPFSIFEKFVKLIKATG